MKKFNKLFLIIILTCFTIAVSAFFTTSNVENASAEEIGSHNSSLFSEETFSSLTYGINWYGPDYAIEIEKAGDDSYKYFDPTAKTILFVHGYQMNTGYGQREILTQFSCIPDEEGYDRYFVNEWIAKGYNVGEFHWNQISDDGLFTAQQKIWSTDSGMAYAKNVDGKRVLTAPNDPTNPKKSVGELFADAYIEAFKHYRGSEIILSGHSMGAQVITLGTRILLDRYEKGEISIDKLPKRISLLDPYAGVSNEETYTISWNGEAMNGRMMIEVLADYLKYASDFGVAVDVYTGMEMAYALPLKGNPSDEIATRLEKAYNTMFNSAVWAFLRDIQSQFASPGDQHVAARDYYFTSIYFMLKTDNGNNAPIGANADTDAVRAAKGSIYYQYQNGDVDFYMDNDYFIQMKATMDKNKIKLSSIDTNTSNAVGGHIYIDVNNSETYGVDLSGITVKLYSQDELAATCLTDKFGAYSFTGLNAGDYKIVFDTNRIRVDVFFADKARNATVKAIKDGKTVSSAKLTDGATYCYLGNISEGDYTIEIDGFMIKKSKIAVSIGDLEENSMQSLSIANGMTTIAKSSLVAVPVFAEDSNTLYYLLGAFGLLLIFVIVAIWEGIKKKNNSSCTHNCENCKKCSSIESETKLDLVGSSTAHLENHAVRESATAEVSVDSQEIVEQKSLPQQVVDPQSTEPIANNSQVISESVTKSSSNTAIESVNDAEINVEPKKISDEVIPSIKVKESILSEESKTAQEVTAMVEESAICDEPIIAEVTATIVDEIADGGYYDIVKDGAKAKYILMSADGKLLYESQFYASYSGAKKAIDNFKTAISENESKVENINGKYAYVFKKGNTKYKGILCDSESEATNALEQVRNVALTAEIK